MIGQVEKTVFLLSRARQRTYSVPTKTMAPLDEATQPFSTRPTCRCALRSLSCYFEAAALPVLMETMTP